jgi:predicted RNA binding protein YcfA (HicA-like mRNA interferase family)
MSNWPSSKANRVLAALFRIGWTLKRQSGSHKTLSRPGWPDVVFAFHDREEIGPRMLARIARRTVHGESWVAETPPLRHYARSTLHWKQLNFERM